MNPVLPLANLSFQRGDYREALRQYKDCLSNLRKRGNSPKTLMAFCESRVNGCYARIDFVVHSAMGTTGDVDWEEVRFHPVAPEARLPMVSIVVPHFNSGGMLYDALDSIAAQSFHQIETLVVDDCSTDGALQLPRLAEYPAWMRLRLVRVASNGGPARCRNLGIRLAQGRGICLLDADDYVDGTVLESRWRIVNAEPAVAAAFSTMTYVDVERRPLGTVILSGIQALSFTDFGSNRFPCSALLFRRRSILLDPFDESLVYGEDFECFSRIAQRGGLYKAAPGTVLYRQHGTSLTHKDAITDLRHRVNITRRVHERELDWALVDYTRNLSEAGIVKGTSLRAFPVACVYALRGEVDKAAALSAMIDADAVASHPPSEAVTSIKFFLTREEFQPADQIARLLAASDVPSLLQFFNLFFRPRHRNFMTEVLHRLLGKNLPPIAPLTDDVIGAPISTFTWSDFIAGPTSRWTGYLMIHRMGEHMPDAAIRGTRDFIGHRGDLEGVYAARLRIVGEEILTDMDSIGPADPDSAEQCQVGRSLRPALLLHELAARSLHVWLTRPEIAGDPLPSVGVEEQIVEGRALQAVMALRLKVIGGVAACHVLANHFQEAATHAG